jgi:hypothetical protein
MENPDFFLKEAECITTTTITTTTFLTSQPFNLFS